MNFLRPKTKQIFQRVLAGIFHPKLVLGVVLLSIVFSNVFILVIPRKVLAEKGATEYGKWYTTDEISIKSMIEVAGPDGVWKDIPFVRVGADTGTIKIRIKLNLEKPESLTFAPDSATNFTQAPRDGVKGPNRLANNTFYENIWPLVGLGSAYGAKDIIKCEWKDVSRLFRFWESRQEIQQCSSKGGKESVNDAMSGSLKSGSEIYNNGTDGFVIGSKELQELTFKPGKTYPIEVWPVLRVNTGDTTLTEAIIASGIDTAVGTLATGFAKPALEVIKKALSKLADVRSGKISATQVVADIVKTTPEMPAEEVKVIAEATLKRFQSLTLTNSLSADIIAQATKSTVDEVVSKGFSGEKAAVIAKAHLEVIANNGGGPKLLNASGQIVETALKEGATKLEPAAAKAATKLGSKAITILGSKWVPIIGWVWTAVDIALYVDTFTKNSLHLYPSNAHKVYVQVYETNAEALAAANEPIPPEVESLVNQEPTSRTGSPTGANDQISGIPKLINQIITAIAQFVVNGIFWLFTTLIAPMLTGVLSVRVYTDAFVNVIYPGWEVLRNVVNIYFIVAIIAIALATLFRVESYKFRPLLIKLIIAALIVNFSLVVCQVILAVADTLQSQFLPNNAEVIGALAKDLMPAQIADIIRSNQLVTNSVFSTAITTLFFMSMAIGGFLVFVAILGYLFVRIVMIWIFLILSPLAFAADVLPSTSGMGQKWWGEFIKYAFFTPVIAFFLNMAAVIAVNYESIFGSISTNLVYGSTNSGKFTVLILATASNILLLVFLFGAVNIAQSFGVFGANVVDGVFKTGVFAPFVGGGGVVALGGKGLQWLGKDVAGGWIQKQYNNRTAKLAEGNSKLKKALYAGLHIPSTVKAFRKDASEELQRSKDLTSAAALSVKRQTPGFKRKGEDPLALYNEHKGKELLEERRGESTDTEEDEVVFGLQLADEAMAGDKDAQLMLPEQLRRMAKNHNLNEFLERYGVKYFGADPKKRDFKYTRENIIGMLHDMEKKGAMSEHINTDLQKRLGKFGYQERDYTLAELTYNHHGHAKAIDVEFDQATKSFVVKGKSIYDRIHNLAQDNSTTQEEYDAIVSREVENLSHSDHELYENATKYEEKVMEALINLKKRDDIDQVKQWWESVVSKKVMPDGSVKPVLAMSGLHLVRNFGAGHEFYASRGNISKKVLELLLPLIKDKEHFRSEIQRAIITDAKVTGRKIYDLELETDELEYKALRVAAVAEKDTSLVGLEAYDIYIPDPQDPKKKIAIKPSDARYKGVLRQQTQALRGILKEDLQKAINAEDDED